MVVQINDMTSKINGHQNCNASIFKMAVNDISNHYIFAYAQRNYFLAYSNGFVIEEFSSSNMSTILLINEQNNRQDSHQFFKIAVS